MKYIIIISFFGLLSCTNDTKSELKSNISGNSITLSDAQQRHIEIETVKLGQVNVSEKLIVNGTIDVPPQNLVSISVPINAYLSSTKLLPGMHVKKGELLASLRDRGIIELQQEYLTAKAQSNAAAQELKRQSELMELKSGSEKALQTAQSELNLQMIKQQGLAEKLRFINLNPDKVQANSLRSQIEVYSPINGYVSKINANIGKYVSASEVLFELINPTDIHLNLKIFEKDVKKLRIGQKLMAFTNSEQGLKHPCEILLIAKNIDANGTVEVHCHFEDYDSSLLPGMFMNAEIPTANATVNSLPESSVVSFEGQTYVFEDKGNKTYEMQKILVGKTVQGVTEILDYKNILGKSIVRKGAYTLLMALKNIEE